MLLNGFEINRGGQPRINPERGLLAEPHIGQPVYARLVPPPARFADMRAVVVEREIDASHDKGTFGPGVVMVGHFGDPPRIAPDETRFAETVLGDQQRTPFQGLPVDQAETHGRLGPVAAVPRPRIIVPGGNVGHQRLVVGQSGVNLIRHDRDECIRVPAAGMVDHPPVNAFVRIVVNLVADAPGENRRTVVVPFDRHVELVFEQRLQFGIGIAGLLPPRQLLLHQHALFVHHIEDARILLPVETRNDAVQLLHQPHGFGHHSDRLGHPVIGIAARHVLHARQADRLSVEQEPVPFDRQFAES